MMFGKHRDLYSIRIFLYVQAVHVKGWDHGGAEVMHLNRFHDFHSGKSF